MPKTKYDGTPSTEVYMAVELGETLDIIKLLQMSWEDRLRVSVTALILLALLEINEARTSAVSLSN